VATEITPIAADWEETMISPQVDTEALATIATNPQADMEATTTVIAIAIATNPRADMETLIAAATATATNPQAAMEQEARAVAMEGLITPILVARVEVWEGACLAGTRVESLGAWSPVLSRRGCELRRGWLKRRVGRDYLLQYSHFSRKVKRF
jgi:hypothetical protein